MTNFWKRKIKNTKEIAKKVGVEEEKIKELKNGERVIEGETMKKVLDAINDEKSKTTLEKQVEEENVINWVRDNDIKELIKKFGFNSQNECARKIGIAQSSLCDISNKKILKYSKNMQMIYDFFNNEFNKQLEEKKNINDEIKKIENDDIILFFKNENTKSLKQKLGLKNDMELSKIAGCSKGSLIAFFSGFYKEISPSMKKAYKNFQDALEKNDKSSKEEKTQETAQIQTKATDNTNTLDDTKKDDSKAKSIELDDNSKQAEEQKQEITKDDDKIEKIEADVQELKDEIGRLYQFYKFVENNNYDNEFRFKENLLDENIKLKKQIERYEKLIDNLK